MIQAPPPLEYETPRATPPLAYRLGQWVSAKRRQVFAVGLALTMGGLGLSIENIRYGPGGGAMMMFCGGALLGATWPILRKE